MPKIALITSSSGQDSIYLANLLIAKNYSVHLLARKINLENSIDLKVSNLGNDFNHSSKLSYEKSKQVTIHYGDLTDSLRITEIIQKIKPDEIYNLGAQSHVGTSFISPIYTANVNALGALRILEAVRNLNLEKKTRIYQASSSELFGKITQNPQNENSPFYPQSPYAISKLFAYWTIVNYREAFNLYACNGILFNHESPIRHESFVTRKITRTLARIKLGLQDILQLGNVEAKRDWGHAKDYVEMQWLMLQQPDPDDYVIATGEQHSVKEFIDQVAKELDFPLYWEGQGIHTKAFDSQGICRIRVDSSYFRPIETENAIGDTKKAREKMGWEPKIKFKDLAREMTLADLKLAEKELSALYKGKVL